MWVTNTVKQTGGNYTSLSAWEDARDSNLTLGDGTNEVAEISGTWDSDDSTAVVINGWTTAADKRVFIYATDAARHKGYWSNTCYRLYGTTDYANTLDVFEDYVTIIGLQFTNSQALAYANVRSSSGATSELLIDSCIARGSENSYRAYTGTIKIINSIGVGVKSPFFTGSTMITLNCVGFCAGNYGAFRRTAGTFYATNCYGYSIGTDDFSQLTSMEKCYSLDTTGTTTNVAYSTANFVNVTAGSENFHLVAGSALIDVGTDLSATFITDINGATRTGTWDIGADEYVTAGPAAVTPRRMLRGWRR